MENKNTQNPLSLQYHVKTTNPFILQNPWEVCYKLRRAHHRAFSSSISFGPHSIGWLCVLTFLILFNTGKLRDFTENAGSSAQIGTRFPHSNKDLGLNRGSSHRSGEYALQFASTAPTPIFSPSLRQNLNYLLLNDNVICLTVKIKHKDFMLVSSPL